MPVPENLSVPENPSVPANEPSQRRESKTNDTSDSDTEKQEDGEAKKEKTDLKSGGEGSSSQEKRSEFIQVFGAQSDVTSDKSFELT